MKGVGGAEGREERVFCSRECKGMNTEGKDGRGVGIHGFMAVTRRDNCMELVC